MVHTRIVACAMVLFLLALAKPALSQTEAQSDKGHSGPHFDTEHIFGFGEGSDIGAQGEWEIESFTIGSFGAAGRDFNIANDTSIRYTITDELRFSVALSPIISTSTTPASASETGRISAELSRKFGGISSIG